MIRHIEQPVEVFCAYAPEDERFYRELVAHMNVLSSQRLCILRDSGDIPAGHELGPWLVSLIEQAELVLVLLSPDYFASLFHNSSVIQHLLAQKASQGYLIPILLRPCDWQNSVFGKLAPHPRDSFLPDSKTQRDTAWLALVHELRSRITHNSITGGAGSRAGEGHTGAWSVPYLRNPFFTGRDDLLAMLHERLQAEGVSGQIRMLAISGLGGIGKTQVALEYAYRYQHEYRAVLWVSAETPEALLADFARLADPLAISTHLEQGAGELVALVKAWLNHHQNWLLIFDNVETLEVVRDYLPTESRNGSMLLTTRATTAGGLTEILPLEEMQGTQGEQLLLRRAGLLASETPLEQVDEKMRQNAAQLVTELGGLPLGIDQAGAYLAETGCGLTHYLRLFRQCRARLLARRGTLPPGHPEPVATTWTLSFQKIEGTAAADLLRLCAFLAPDRIPESIFLKGASALGPRLSQFAVDPLALDGALAELRTYSLMKRNAENNTISLHRLVQTVVRDALKPASQRTWVRRAIRALGQAIPEPDPAHWHAWQPYLPHIFACVQLIDDYHLFSEESGWLLSQAGTMLRYYARYAEAERLYEKALRINEQVVGTEHPATATTLDHLATLLGIQRKYEQAVPLYERALRIREHTLGSEHPDTASTMNGLGLLYSNWHRYEASQRFYEQALHIRERVLGPEHPDTATTLDNLAMLYRQQGKFEQAEPLFKQALQIREHTLGSEHPATASTLNNLAVLYRLRGDYARAQPFFERALSIREQILGSEHPATATAISNLAYLLRLQGQYEQALHLYERALRIREHAFGPEHPNATITWLNIGELYQEMGTGKQAEDAMRHALLTHEQALGKDHPRVVSILEVYSQWLRYAGREEEARLFEERVQAARKR